jgi:hypothetical protein
MKMVPESSSSDERRPLGGVRFNIRERQTRDFAVGTRGNELYFV